jgi:predicted dehydrogenase
MPRPVRVGVLGLEGHLNEILDPLPRLKSVSIECFQTADDQEAARFKGGEGTKGARRFTDYRRMLDEEKLDVVAVCNDNGTRAQAIVECANRGLHVMAEKPVALTLKELEGVKRAVEKNRVRLGCLLKMRTDPWFQAMRRIVESGAVGEVIAVDAQKSYKYAGQQEWKKRRSRFGGTMPWIGVDLIDLIRYTSGREMTAVKGVQAHIGLPELGEMENVAVCLLRMDNGGAVTVRLDYLRRPEAPTHGDDRLRLAGTKGIVEYQAGTGVVLQRAGNIPEVIRGYPERRWVFEDFLSSIYLGEQVRISEKSIYETTETAIGAWMSAG